MIRLVIILLTFIRVDVRRITGGILLLVGMNRCACRIAFFIGFILIEEWRFIRVSEVFEMGLVQEKMYIYCSWS